MPARRLPKRCNRTVSALHVNEFDEAQAVRIIDAHAHQQGACLPILHALQEAFGYVDKRAIALIAGALNISKAEVHGVISFYHEFRGAPRGSW